MMIRSVSFDVRESLKFSFTYLIMGGGIILSSCDNAEEVHSPKDIDLEDLERVEGG